MQIMVHLSEAPGLCNCTNKKFMALFCFTSSDQSEMVDWLMADCKGSFNKISCIEYTWLKIVTKTFLEKMQHKMQYVNAQEIWCTFVLHF